MPFAATYLVGFVLAAFSNFVWEPARYVAVPLLFIGPAGAALVAALMLVEGQRVERSLLWSAFAGGLLTVAFQLWVALFVGSDDNSIGTVVIWALGWLLLAAGMFAKRAVPVGQTA